MSNLSSESLLYDTGHAAELLNMDEHTLMAYIHQLSLSPKVDEPTGNLMLSQRDLELLQKATRQPSRGEAAQEEKPGFIKRLGTNPLTASLMNKAARQPSQYVPESGPDRPAAAPVEKAPERVAPAEPARNIQSTPAMQPSNHGSNHPSTHSMKQPLPPPTKLTTHGGEKKENLALIVEAVSQAKEGILKDLARLLDDKLAGLDEVVVELIRCKSENDSLKQKLKAALDEKETLRYELSKFKLVQFGFYRKTN